LKRYYSSTTYYKDWTYGTEGLEAYDAADSDEIRRAIDTTLAETKYL
jgi:hypothetical protein